MRCGRKIGTREPMRKNSMCSMARRRPRSISSLSSENSSGSPPESSTSRTSVCVFEVADRLLEVRVEFLFARAADDPAAGAVPAVARATVRHEEQNAVRVAVDQSRHGHVAILAARVGHLEGRDVRFLQLRHDLPADRAVRVVALDEIEKMRRDGQRQLAARDLHPGAFAGGEDEVLLKLFQPW